MSDISLTCDACGRTVQGTTFVNGMKFCAKCYQETFGNNYSQTDIINAQCIEQLKQENKTKDERIAELEREVAEYKQQCYDCKHLHKKLELNIKNKLIGDVERQNIKIQELENFKEKCIDGDYIPAIIAKRFEELQNQKAIECLKEVREKIFEIFEKTEFNPNQCGEYYGNYVTTRFVGDIIDNKIKELEGE